MLFANWRGSAWLGQACLSELKRATQSFKYLGCDQKVLQQSYNGVWNSQGSQSEAYQDVKKNVLWEALIMKMEGAEVTVFPVSVF